MLDQNTDRMWYVIGAVIVGAALIFLVNSSFPQLFASVGETFEDKVTDVSKTIDNIGSTEINALEGAEWTQGILYGDKDGASVIDTTKLTSDGRHWFTPKHIPINGATSITIELTKSLPDFNFSRGRVNAYDKDKSYIGTPIDDLRQSEPYINTYAVPPNTEYIRVLLVYGNIGEYIITLHYD